MARPRPQFALDRVTSEAWQRLVSPRPTRSRATAPPLAVLFAFCLASCGTDSTARDGADLAADDSAPAESLDPATPARPDISRGANNPAPASDSLAPLTPDGWGPLRVGMNVAEIVAAAGEDANPGAAAGPDPGQCDEFRPARAPERMLVMVENGRLSRISLLSGAAVKTERGFGVGDRAAAISNAYGAEATASPHKYLPAPAEYITVWRTAPPAPAARGTVYEVGADGLVSHIHAGGPSIQYVEGCL